MGGGDDRDLELMTRLIEKDDRALGELLERHGGAVYGLALRITSDAQLAEEVLQDSFLKLAREARSYRTGPLGVAPWLMRMARNGAIDLVRKRKRRKTTGDPEAIDLVADDRAPSAIEGVAREEFGREVRQALAEMPDGPRKALEAAYFSGLTHTEIAERLAVPLGTAKTWVRTGLRTLRERLGRFLEGRGA